MKKTLANLVLASSILLSGCAGMMEGVGRGAGAELKKIFAQEEEQIKLLPLKDEETRKHYENLAISCEENQDYLGAAMLYIYLKDEQNANRLYYHFIKEADVENSDAIFNAMRKRELKIRPYEVK